MILFTSDFNSMKIILLDEVIVYNDKMILCKKIYTLFTESSYYIYKYYI